MSLELAQAPPSDLDAEAAVLSACLLAPEELPGVRELLQPEQFYSDANRRIYQAMCDLADAHQQVDAATVAARLRLADRLEQIGGTPYIAQIIDATPAVAHVAEHARIVADRATLRRAIAICRQHAADAHGDVDDVRAWLQSLETAVYGLSSGSQVVGGPETLATATRGLLVSLTAIRDSGATPTIPTGLAPLDAALSGGLRRGHQYVLAGATGLGKSSVGLSIALSVAKSGRAVVVVSCEMPVEDLTARAIATERGLPVSDLLGGTNLKTHWGEMLLGMEAIRQLPLALEYRPGATIAGVRSAIRQGMQQLRSEGHEGELGLVVIDYLQIMRGERQRGDSREAEVSTLSRQLLWIAGEFNCPTLVLAQLNRGVSSRDDKRPRLSDLRDSGAIEQDASAVLMLYRDDYYSRDRVASSGVSELEIAVAKNRNGSTDTVRVAFHGASTRVSELDPHVSVEDIFGGYDE